MTTQPSHLSPDQSPTGAESLGEAADELGVGRHHWWHGTIVVTLHEEALDRVVPRDALNV